MGNFGYIRNCGGDRIEEKAWLDAAACGGCVSDFDAAFCGCCGIYAAVFAGFCGAGGYRYYAFAVFDLPGVSEKADSGFLTDSAGRGGRGKGLPVSVPYGADSVG